MKSLNLSKNTSDVHNTFNLTPFTVAEVHKALKQLNLRKPSGPDHLEPRFLKLALDLSTEPLKHLFDLSLASNKIPKIWKAAYVRPLLKGGVPTILNNYRPLSNLSVLSKVLESLVSEHVKDYVHTHQILNVHQGFRKNHHTAAMKVLNYIIGALDKKEHYVQGCTLTFFFRSTRPPKLKNVGAQKKNGGTIGFCSEHLLASKD